MNSSEVYAIAEEIGTHISSIDSVISTFEQAKNTINTNQVGLIVYNITANIERQITSLNSAKENLFQAQAQANKYAAQLAEQERIERQRQKEIEERKRRARNEDTENIVTTSPTRLTNIKENTRLTK